MDDMMLSANKTILQLSNSPLTGDQSKPWLWITIAAVVVILAVVFVVLSRRNKDDEE